MQYVLILINSLVAAWLATSMLIDFIVIPDIFKNISDLEQAGHLGMLVFLKYNFMEMIFSISFLIIGLILAMRTKSSKKVKFAILFISMSLNALSFSYYFYLTPQISSLAQQKNKYEMETTQYRMIEANHNFFHKLYIKCDSFKMLLLLLVFPLLVYWGRRIDYSDKRVVLSGEDTL